jgi:hypothetical protein
MTLTSSAGRHVASVIIAIGLGTASLQRYPFPQDDALARAVAYRAPTMYRVVSNIDTAMRYTTPYLLVLFLTSTGYVFLSRRGRAIVPGRLPVYPKPETRKELFLILGERHHPTRVEPAAKPTWLTIPERGLYTGIAVLGAIGTGKTSGVIYPALDQLLGYAAKDRGKRLGGLCLEVKGDLHLQVRRILRTYQREEDYIEVSLSSGYRYNPLYGDVDAFALAFGISQIIIQLYGRSHEPFWTQAETNLLKFLIQLHQTAGDYVTLLDIYQAAIDPNRIAAKLAEAERRWYRDLRVSIAKADYLATDALQATPWQAEGTDRLSTAWTADLDLLLATQGVPHDRIPHAQEPPGAERKRAQLDAVRRWYRNDWLRIEPKLRTNIVEGVSVFLSIFDDVDVKHTFCPPRELYDPVANADGRYGKPLPPFAQLVEEGRVCVLNLPLHTNPLLSKAIAVWLKHHFQRAMLQRIPRMADAPERHWRPAIFVADEFQMLVTAGEQDPSGDEHFFALSRQAKCIPIIATQSVSSLRTVLPGDTWRTVLQTLRTLVCCGLSDTFSTQYASERCGRAEQLRPQYTVGESGQDARVSLLTGRPTAQRATMSASKSYHTQMLPVFEPKAFSELAVAQAIVLASDGVRQLPPTRCYLKPAHLDPNVTYFEQVARGQLS